MSSKSEPNIFFLVIDSFRNDKLFPKDKTSKTKNLESLISKGTYYSNTFSSSDGTLLSWASIFTGLFPFKTGVTLSNKHKLSKNITNYIKLLKKNGYHAYASIPDISFLYPLTEEFDNADKFHDYYFELSNGLGEKIVKKLNSNSLQEPWIFFIHINDLHLPNWPSKDFDNELFGTSRYERTISQIDFWIGKFLEKIDLEKTLVIITSDHGDYVPFVNTEKETINLEPHRMEKTLREIGKKFPTALRKKIASSLAKTVKTRHESKIQSLDLTPYYKRQLLHTRASPNHYLFDELMHVPLIFSGAGFVHSSPLKTLTRTIDIFPTIIDFIGLKNPPNIDGQSLLSLANNESFEEQPVFMQRDVIISQLEHDVEGIRTSKYKYFRSVSNPSDKIHLYDVKEDPLEEHNISENNPKLVEEMEEILQKIKNVPSNDSSTELSPEYEEKVKDELRKLGYI